VSDLGNNWLQKPADKVVRHPRMGDMRPIHIRLPEQRATSTIFSTPFVLVYAFGGLIAIGTLLLMLPFSHNGSESGSIMHALFTATSAATVTGLIIVDTPTFWSLPGQIVIVALMFMGGLGIMTIAAALFVIAGQRASLSQRLIMRETTGATGFTNITNITARIFIWALLIQAIGFSLLFIRFVFLYPPLTAAWHALFQGVSAFNNAGFTSIPDSASLSIFLTDNLVLGIVAGLIIVGSLSYWVIAELVSGKKISTFSLNTKLVLVTTPILIVLGAVTFFLFESNNSATIGNESILTKICSSVFHSVNRTSGFSTIDFGYTSDNTNLLYSALMFVGGSSASVAGGIKVNTLALVIIGAWMSMRGLSGTKVFGRRLPNSQIQWAFSLFLFFLFGVSCITLALSITDSNHQFLDLLFEATSSLGTVGFSTGITGDLSTAGKSILVMGMFIGRLIPAMLIIAAFSSKNDSHKFRYGQEEVLVG